MSLAVAEDAGRLASVSSREDEFRAFYAEEYSALAGYCWTLVRDRELAHDLAQEAFTRMLTTWLRVAEPRAYLYRVATNLARKAWRARDRDSGLMRAIAADRPADHPAPDPARLVLRTAVEQLPKRLREVVLLHYFADLSVNDVATAIGRPPGTVKRQLSEARLLLAGALELPSE